MVLSWLSDIVDDTPYMLFLFSLLVYLSAVLLTRLCPITHLSHYPISKDNPSLLSLPSPVDCLPCLYWVAVVVCVFSFTGLDHMLARPSFMEAPHTFTLKYHIHSQLLRNKTVTESVNWCLDWSTFKFLPALSSKILEWEWDMLPKTPPLSGSCSLSWFMLWCLVEVHYGMTQSSDSHLSLPLILSCMTRLCTADNVSHARACTCTCGVTSDHIIWSPWIKLVSWLLGCLAVCVCWREREASLWWNSGQPLFSKLPPFQSHCLCKFIFWMIIL